MTIEESRYFKQNNNLNFDTYFQHAGGF